MPLRRPSSPKKPDPAATGKSLLPLEALEFESPSAVVIATRVPPLSRAINFLVFLLVAATLAAGGLIQIDKIVSGQGKLVAEASNIVLQPFDQSIVESIDVRKGDIVREGQVLARLNPTFSEADLAAMKDQVDSLSATAARLEAEITGSAYPPGATAPLMANEAPNFERSALTDDRHSLGASFRPVMAGLEAATAGTFALVDPPAHGAAPPPAELQGWLSPVREGENAGLWTARSHLSVPAPLAPTTSGPIDTPEQANPYVELEASIFNQRAREYTSALEHHDHTINQLQMRIDGSEARAKYYRERAEIAGRVESLRQTLLEREAGSLLNKLIATDTRLDMQGLLAEAESDATQAGRQKAAQAAERESFIHRWTVQNLRDLAETRRNLAQAEQSYAKASLHNDLIALTAPRDAVVLSVATVSAGSVVTSAEPLIHLVPMDVPLSVEVDIAGIDSGYVRPGDEVAIKFDTLPYLRYGKARGVVRSISADSFNPEALVQENDSSLPTRPNMLYYKGDIAIDELELHDTPPGFRLMPGMPVTADVKVGTRSILAYFVARILPVAYEGIREP